MNTLTGLLLMVVIGTICFFLGIRVVTWGMESREEEWRALYQNQEAKWMQYLDRIYVAYRELMVIASREGSVNHPKSQVLRRTLDYLFDETQIKLGVIYPSTTDTK